MVDLDAMIQAKLAAAADLLKLPGVTGVGVGYREKNGQVTNEHAIRVYVEHKRPLSEVPAESRIPTEIGGFKIDVIEKGHDVLISSLENVHRRPIETGLEITRVGYLGSLAFGSVCCFVEKDTQIGAGPARQVSSDIYMLAAAHVLEPPIKMVDDLVYQPRPFGYINRCAVKADINWPNDAGLARLDRGITWKNEIYGVGPIIGRADPVLDQIVRKQGRTTGLTKGVVTDTSYTYFNNDLGKYFYDCFVISSLTSDELFADHGDSGGPVFIGGQDIGSDFPLLVGMIHARVPNTNQAVACKIRNVLNFNTPQAPGVEGPTRLVLVTRGRPTT